MRTEQGLKAVINHLMNEDAVRGVARCAQQSIARDHVGDDGASVGALILQSRAHARLARVKHQFVVLGIGPSRGRFNMVASQILLTRRVLQRVVVGAGGNSTGVPLRTGVRKIRRGGLRAKRVFMTRLSDDISICKKKSD